MRNACGRHARRRARRKAALPRAEQQLRTQARRRHSLVAHCTACRSARAPGCARGCSKLSARAGSWCANTCTARARASKLPGPPRQAEPQAHSAPTSPAAAKAYLLAVGDAEKESRAPVRGPRRAAEARVIRASTRPPTPAGVQTRTAPCVAMRRPPTAHTVHLSPRAPRRAALRAFCATGVQSACGELRRCAGRRTTRDDAPRSAQRATTARTRCSGACALRCSAQRALQHHALLRLRQGASEHRPGSRNYARQAAARRAEVLDSARTRCGAVLERARTFDKATYEPTYGRPMDR